MRNKTKLPKKPKPRVPVPPADQAHQDKRKEADRRRCRGKIQPPDNASK